MHIKPLTHDAGGQTDVTGHATYTRDIQVQTTISECAVEQTELTMESFSDEDCTSDSDTDGKSIVISDSDESMMYSDTAADEPMSPFEPESAYAQKYIYKLLLMYLKVIAKVHIVN